LSAAVRERKKANPMKVDDKVAEGKAREVAVSDLVLLSSSPPRRSASYIIQTFTNLFLNFFLLPTIQ
jgi:hypothetical protein